MQVQVTFRNMEASDAIEMLARDKAKKLQRYYPRLLSCRVVVDEPHRHQRQGKHFQVRIELGVPGNDLVIQRGDTDNPAFEDAYVTLREAFAAARRELITYGERQRSHTKRPESNHLTR